MTQQMRDGSPSRMARWAGGLFLVSAAIGWIGSYELYGSPRAVTSAVSALVMVAVVVLVFLVFRAVDFSVSFLGLAVMLVACLLEGLRAHPNGLNMGLMLAGPYYLIVSALILQSRFLPRWLAIPAVLSGLAWLTYLLPQFLAHLWPWNMVLGMLGELVVFVWLLAQGVDDARWWEQSGVRT